VVMIVVAVASAMIPAGPMLIPAMWLVWHAVRGAGIQLARTGKRRSNGAQTRPRVWHAGGNGLRRTKELSRVRPGKPNRRAPRRKLRIEASGSARAAGKPRGSTVNKIAWSTMERSAAGRRKTVAAREAAVRSRKAATAVRAGESAVGAAPLRIYGQNKQANHDRHHSRTLHAAILRLCAISRARYARPRFNGGTANLRARPEI
jgi:hypothetical protein